MNRSLNSIEFEFVEAMFDPITFLEMLWWDRGYNLEDFQDARILTITQEPFVIDTSCPETGKTFNLISDIYYTGMLFPKEMSLFTAPRRVHLKPVIDGIEDRKKHSPLANLLIEKIIKYPEIEIHFKNGHIVHCRLASTEGEAYFGIHPSVKIYGDEIEIFPRKSFDELFSRAKAGCSIYLCGMINGDRQSVLYQVSHKKIGNFIVINIPRWRSRRMTLKQYKTILRNLGGKGTQEAKNKVFSLWGEPVSKLFNLAKIDALTRVEEDYYDVSVDSQMLDVPDDISPNEVIGEKEVEDVIVLPNVDWNSYVILMQSWDIGFRPDPSIGMIWGFTGAKWDLIQIYRLAGIPLKKQGKFMAFINDELGGDVYNAFDFGYYGRAIEEWCIHFGYPKRLLNRVAFQENMKVAEYDEDTEIDEKGNLLTEAKRDEGILEVVKYRATETLIAKINQSQVTFPPISEEFDKELINAWQKKRDGKMLYNLGNDHYISSLRCWAKCVYEIECGWFPSEEDDSDKGEVVVPLAYEDWIH